MTKRILHVVVDDDWLPSKEELDEIANLFIAASKGPIGTVVTTRKGVRATVISEYDEVKVSLDELGSSIKLTKEGIEINAKNKVDLLNKLDELEVLQGKGVPIPETLFSSGDDKRLESNTFPDSLNPDDVSYNYRMLDNKEKENMRQIKMLAQTFINKIRSLDSMSHSNLEEAIKDVQLASMWATKFITRDKNKKEFRTGWGTDK